MKKWDFIRRKGGNEKMEAGYFLLNILIAIGIISLITALSFPYISNYQPHLELNASKKELASELRHAQQLTITEQSIYGVELEEGSNKYRLLRHEHNATSTIEEFELSESVVINEVASSSDNLVEFNFYGGVDEACLIELKSSQEETEKIRVKPSGYISLED